MATRRAAIYRADTWHVDDGVASDGSGRPAYHRSGIRRVFTPEYKLAILAEYDAATESGEKGAILRREGLYSSIITDWRRQHRQGLIKKALGRSDGGRGGPSLSELARLRAENERLRTKLAQAEAIIDVQPRKGGGGRLEPSMSFAHSPAMARASRSFGTRRAGSHVMSPAA